jgi:long-chain acyl-CoA synthetase
MVPVMFSLLERAEGFSAERLASLRQLVYGAAPISPDVLARWLELLPEADFIQGYGMTEAASVLTFLAAADHRRPGEALTAAGRPVIGVELQITDSLGNPLADGEAGEVCARGGNLMREYWNNPEETAAAMREGWYRTGDMGYIDSRGLLHLTDRMKDMIVTGGENVYSTEVENAIAAHPDVAEVAVIGVPSETWGEAVHAIVVLKEEGKATADDLIEYARRVLAGFKVPKSVEFQKGPLPLSGAFKPLKRELRKRYWQGRDRQVS